MLKYDSIAFFRIRVLCHSAVKASAVERMSLHSPILIETHHRCQCFSVFMPWYFELGHVSADLTEIRVMWLQQ
jgi:hypothetical protein